MLVTESVVFRFDGGPFTYAYRHVSAHRTDGLLFLEASMDAVALPPGGDAWQVEVQSGDPLKVTSHFLPTSDSSHIFVVRYRAVGVVSTGEADTLRWYVIPADHGYLIDQATIWLNYSAGALPLQAPFLDRAFDSVPTDSGVKLTAVGIADDEGVILTVRFPGGSLVTTPPSWQERELETAAVRARVLPVGLLSGLATVLLGIVGLLVYARGKRRELSLPEPIPMLSPPDDRLPPAVVGKLLGSEAHSPTATLLDLAQRGVLRIREEQGWMGTRKYVVERTEINPSLLPHEQGLLQALFRSGEVRIDMREILTRLSSKKSLFYGPLERELIERGRVDPERKRKRMMLLAVGWLSMFLGLGLLIGASITTRAFLTADRTVAAIAAVVAGVGGGVFVVSVPFSIYAGTYSILTPGEKSKRITGKGFAPISPRSAAAASLPSAPTLSNGTSPSLQPLAWEGWARAFQKLGGARLPDWFQSLSGGNDFGAIVGVMSSADATSLGGADGGGGAGGGANGAGYDVLSPDELT